MPEPVYLAEPIRTDLRADDPGPHACLASIYLRMAGGVAVSAGTTWFGAHYEPLAKAFGQRRR